MTPKWKDLGLSYEEAVHGIQSAILARISHDISAGKWTREPDDNTSFAGPKHMRVGLDLSKAEFGGLSYLLIQKGIITDAEYREAMRLAANQELASYETMLGEILGHKVSFR